jgi:small conductance mechanosensitive channel
LDSASYLSAEKLETVVQGFFWMLPNFGIALVVALLFLIGAWIARAVLSRWFRRRGRENLGELLGEFARWGVILFGALVVAAIVFPSIKPADLLSTLGIGSIAVGFAFKDILQNWLAGLLILIRQPFTTGDQIVVGGFEGTVQHIEARATLIKTYDGRLVVIPNADVYSKAVIVNTAFEKRRSEYAFGIGYGDDIGRATQVILDALATVDGVEKDPAPDVLPWELGSSSVEIKVRWWTDSRRSNVVTVRARVVGALKTALGEAGIDLPFPTQTILLHDQIEDADGDRDRQREGWPAPAEVRSSDEAQEPERRPPAKVPSRSH